jgi:hypothetical protein
MIAEIVWIELYNAVIRIKNTPIIVPYMEQQSGWGLRIGPADTIHTAKVRSHTLEAHLFIFTYIEVYELEKLRPALTKGYGIS